MKKIVKISIARAKEISSLGYDEVIIVGCNYETGIQHVTTYGRSQMACENAAKGGNAIKRLLKWPENKCNDKPSRQKIKENKKWSDEDMIRYASKCYFNREENIAFSDLLSEYENGSKLKYGVITGEINMQIKEPLPIKRRS